MHINWQAKELNIKIVYYGPALSGKTTTLEQVYAGVDPSRCSDMVSLKTKEDRTLYFDFLQLEMGTIGGLSPKIHLYTVPGQTYYESTRKLVLEGADGVVFVADSAADRVDDNREIWRNMHTHLEQLGLARDDFPITVQFNKQDLSHALSAEFLCRLLRIRGYPTFETAAIDGEGVFDALRSITRQVMQQISQQMA